MGFELTEEAIIEKVLKDLPRDRLLALARSQQVTEKLLDSIARRFLGDEELCVAVLEHTKVSIETICYVAENGSPSIAGAVTRRRALMERSPRICRALLVNPYLGSGIKDVIEKLMEAISLREAGEKEKKEKKVDLYRMIKELSTGQRLALAKKGNKEVRMILVRDANEMIALEVITSPRITDAEIVQISQMQDVSEKVLRAIGSNRRYRFNKAVVLNLLHNPKTPVSVSLGLGMPRLSDRELSGLTKNRNIPTVVSRAAGSILDKRKKASRPPGGGH